MKKATVLLFLLAFTAGLVFSAGSVSLERFSFKSLKQSLKKDSSDAANAALAKKVLENGVSFEYTLKRENNLRKAGAKDVLISAI
jgi:hypothetical protein